MEQLMNKVGGQGRYQWYTFLVFNLQWFLVGWFLLGIGFYFETKPFTCKTIENERLCQEHVCALPEAEWKFFLPNVPNTMAYEW
jgi:hypothetical protein